MQAVDIILDKCKGMIMKMKPKLNTHLLNVTFHVGSLMPKTKYWGDTVQHPVIGEVQIRLRSGSVMSRAAHFIYELQRS